VHGYDYPIEPLPEKNIPSLDGVLDFGKIFWADIAGTRYQHSQRCRSIAHIDALSRSVATRARWLPSLPIRTD
jgi:hypothetical protein